MSCMAAVLDVLHKKLIDKIFFYCETTETIASHFAFKA